MTEVSAGNIKFFDSGMNLVPGGKSEFLYTIKKKSDRQAAKYVGEDKKLLPFNMSNTENAARCERLLDDLVAQVKSGKIKAEWNGNSVTFYTLEGKKIATFTRNRRRKIDSVKIEDETALKTVLGLEAAKPEVAGFDPNANMNISKKIAKFFIGETKQIPSIKLENLRNYAERAETIAKLLVGIEGKKVGELSQDQRNALADAIELIYPDAPREMIEGIKKGEVKWIVEGLRVLADVFGDKSFKVAKKPEETVITTILAARIRVEVKNGTKRLEQAIALREAKLIAAGKRGEAESILISWAKGTKKVDSYLTVVADLTMPDGSTKISDFFGISVPDRKNDPTLFLTGSWLFNDKARAYRQFVAVEYVAAKIREEEISAPEIEGADLSDFRGLGNDVFATRVRTALGEQLKAGKITPEQYARNLLWLKLVEDGVISKSHYLALVLLGHVDDPDLLEYFCAENALVLLKLADKTDVHEVKLRMMRVIFNGLKKKYGEGNVHWLVVGSGGKTKAIYITIRKPDGSFVAFTLDKFGLEEYDISGLGEDASTPDKGRELGRKIYEKRLEEGGEDVPKKIDVQYHSSI
jgi:hypothetical protein